MTTSESIFNEKLKEYYALKEKYDLTLVAYKHDILEKKISMKEKRNEYAMLRPKCINCGRSVGSIFSLQYLKNNEETKTFLDEMSTENNKGHYGNRFLIAKCGDKVVPCNLDILINLGEYSNYQDDIQKLEKDLNNTKKQIIDKKNKGLFGYINKESAVNDFKLLQNEITSEVDFLQLILSDYKNITANEEDKQGLNIKIQESFDIIGGIKLFMNEYRSENNIQFVKDAVDMYVNNLLPTLKDILKQRYLVCEVTFDKQDQMYTLLQRKNSIVQMQNVVVDAEVVKFVVGGAFTKKNKSKTTTKKTKNPLGVAKQTRKIRAPQVEIVSDEDELNENENENENTQQAQSQNV